jgi:hypothetical protein
MFDNKTRAPSYDLSICTLNNSYQHNAATT